MVKHGLYIYFVNLKKVKNVSFDIKFSKFELSALMGDNNAFSCQLDKIFII